MLVQEVSGQPYETYVEQHIFAPLEMHRSFAAEAEAEEEGLVTGHRYWFGSRVPRTSRSIAAVWEPGASPPAWRTWPATWLRT